MTDELLPCPFCGGEPFGEYGTRAEINCTKCDALVRVSLHPGMFTTYDGQRRVEEAKAIETWNRRTAPPQTKTEGN
jgi:Lar family restriction alleviation protein